MIAPIVCVAAACVEAVSRASVPATSPHMREALAALEDISLEYCEQVEQEVKHFIYAGMYVRTLRLPWNERIEREGGVVMTGALIKRATVLIVAGRTRMLEGDGEWVDLDGYNVFQGSAGRKQMFATRGPVVMTMCFPTQAQTVEEAEAEFTDECDRLSSRRDKGV